MAWRSVNEMNVDERKKKKKKNVPKLVTGRFVIILLLFLVSTVKSRISGSTFTNYIAYSKRTVAQKKAFQFESRLNFSSERKQQQQQFESDRLVETLEPLVRKCSQLPYILFSEQSHFEIQNEISINAETDSSYSCHDSLKQRKKYI